MWSFLTAAVGNDCRWTKSFIHKYLISSRLPGRKGQCALTGKMLLIIHTQKKVYSASEFEVCRLSTNNVKK